MDQLTFQRYELKFLMTKDQQKYVLEAMKPYMQLDQYGLTTIRNLYYDTPDFLLIRRSLEQPVYKEKLRLRSYGKAGEQTPAFLELKKKYDGVVYKRRICMPYAHALGSLTGREPFPVGQISREIQSTLGFYGSLAPAVFLSYDRQAYFTRQESAFRVTFDSNIRYRQEDLVLDGDCSGIPLLGEDQVLMEIKTPDSIPMWMTKVLSQQGIYKISFSKYGSAYADMMREWRGSYQYVS